MRGPVAGWKAGLAVIAALLVLFGLLNWVADRYAPRPRPRPTPTIIR